MGHVEVFCIRLTSILRNGNAFSSIHLTPPHSQEREQGRRKPDAATRVYLAVSAKNREAVLDALAFRQAAC